MEIIKHGNVFHEVDCPHCEAVIGFVDDDIKVSIGSDTLFGELVTWHKEYIFCPDCKKMIKFKYKRNGEDLPNSEICTYR